MFGTCLLSNLIVCTSCFSKLHWGLNAIHLAVVPTFPVWYKFLSAKQIRHCYISTSNLMKRQRTEHVVPHILHFVETKPSYPLLVWWPCIAMHAMQWEKLVMCKAHVWNPKNFQSARDFRKTGDLFLPKNSCFTSRLLLPKDLFASTLLKIHIIHIIIQQTCNDLLYFCHFLLWIKH